MATVNKPGGIIHGVPVPEWDSEEFSANTSVTVSIDNLIIDPEAWGEVILEISGKLMMYNKETGQNEIVELSDGTAGTILLQYNLS